MIKKITLFLILFTNFLVAQTPSGFVAKYNFNNNRLNSVDSESLTGTAADINGLQYTADRAGNSSQALEVNGARLTGYSINANVNQITFAFWIKKAPGSETILTARNSTSANGFSFFCSGNNLGISVSNINDTKQFIAPQPALFDNNWHQIAITYKSNGNGSGDVSVYFDGVVNQTFSTQLDLNTDNFMFTTGTPADLEISPVQSATSSYEDEIDDIFLYFRALNAQEINNLFNARTVPKLIYVNISANGANNGNSWVDAYTDLNNALVNSIQDDEIWVAKGTYNPKKVGNANSVREDRFNINTKNIKLYGGFAGTEVALSGRDITLVRNTNATILSGDLLQNDSNAVSFTETSRADNAYRIMEINNNVLIDGFTFKGGFANGANNSGDNQYGAALNIGDNIFITDLTIRNCVFENNVAHYGSAMYLNNNSDIANVTINACNFNNNLSVFSTIYAIPNAGKTLNFKVANSVFNSNNSRTDTRYNRSSLGTPAFTLLTFHSGSVMSFHISNNSFVNNSTIGSSPNFNYPVFAISRNNGLDLNTRIISNNIFWGNTTNGTTAIAYNKNYRNFNPPTVLKFWNSIDEDNLSLLTSSEKANTSNVNPNLTSDFQLQSTSTSAIDQGRDSNVFGSTDNLGRQRIFDDPNYANGSLGSVDIGAFEFGSFVLSLSTINDVEFTVYPNPATDKIFVKTKSEISNIILYNTIGKKVATSLTKSVDLKDLPHGVYYLKVKINNGEIGVKKVIKN